MGKSLFFAGVSLFIIVIFMNVVSSFAQKREEVKENGPKTEMTRDYNSLEKQLSGN